MAQVSDFEEKKANRQQGNKDMRELWKHISADRKLWDILPLFMEKFCQ